MKLGWIQMLLASGTLPCPQSRELAAETERRAREAIPKNFIDFKIQNRSQMQDLNPEQRHCIWRCKSAQTQTAQPFQEFCKWG